MGSIGTQFDNDNKHAELLRAQAEVYKHLFAYADTLVLRSAIELRIPDIIHSHGQPITLSQIASKIQPTPRDISQLARVMRMLVRKNIFTINYNNNQSQKETVEPLYGLTETSKLLLHDQDLTFAPMFLTLSHQSITKPWYEISRSIKEGGTPFAKAHGESVWEMALNNPEFNFMFNNGMASATQHKMNAVITGYKDGFSKLEGSLVDVGGGTGHMITKIVEKYPNIKGINFDLPHAVENAPQHIGVTHVGGDMFKEIPCANNVIIKSVLHDWADEDCIKILKNCQKAISEKKGKVIIVDVILHPDRHEMFDDATIALDLLMMTNCVGGKERTLDEWNYLLNKAGFSHFNIIPLQTTLSLSIIEAFLY